MNFNAYIERQKSIIRQKSCGQTVLGEKTEKELQTSSVDRLFEELDGIEGLNTRERMFYATAQNVCVPCYSKA